jgi:hypothetical protein
MVTDDYSRKLVHTTVNCPLTASGSQCRAAGTQTRPA